MGVFWPCPTPTASRSTTPARRGCSSRERGTRSRRAPGRSTSPTARRASTSPPTAAGRGRGRGLPGHPDHRPRGEPVPVGHADPADRPAGRPVPRSRASRCTRGWPRSSASPTATGRRWSRGAGDHAARQVVTTIRPDTVFVPYHWAGPQERQPADHRRPGPDLEDPRVQGVRSACARRTARPSTPHARAAAVSSAAVNAQAGRPGVLHRPEPLHRLPGVRAGVHRVRHAQGATR